MNRFLSLFLFTFLIHVIGYSQFDLVKDFDGGSQNSFGFYDQGGPVYSIVNAIDPKLFVAYDSIANKQHTNIAVLASINDAGKSQRLAVSTLYPLFDGAAFFDFKTLPDGRVAFINIESTISYKVIVTDGTTAGTVAVYTAPSPIKGLELIDNGLYFTHHDNTGHSLMKTDLTTLLVTEVAAFGTLHTISDISKISDTRLIFLAPDAADGDKLKLYVSDGTAGGTTALAVINSGAAVSEEALLVQVGNKVYFFSKLPDVTCCSALWVTDGTVAGTQKLKELVMLATDHLISQKMIFGWKDKFYFAGGESTLDPGHMLWVSDGTVAGTTLLMEQSLENIHPRSFTVFQDALYFITASGTHYTNKLHKTDGTAAGTVPVELKYQTHAVEPYTITADEDYLYLGGGNTNAFFVAELFRYDGIQPQCAMLEGEAGYVYSQPRSLFIHNTKLYFVAQISTTGDELYTTGGDFIQGIATGTRSAAALNSVVYPNPAQDVVTVASSEKIVSLRVINAQGSVVAETTASTLDVASYAAGIYTIEILFANNEKAYQKLVVNN